MRMVDIIQKKKLGKELSQKEISFAIYGFVEGEIPDYQMSAFLMAIYYSGMSNIETTNLTMAMLQSGDQIDLSDIKGIKVDKHSTGGVGDKLSLVIVPLVASIGIPVAKMSGRGLGYTGGTIDKLESIKGFRTDLNIDEFKEQLKISKMAISAQTVNLVPADKKMYSLRNATSTIDSIPLIASSIMSKKIASGADAIVLDVKVGSGAFMKSLEDAKILAQAMVEIGKSLNKKIIVVITDMSQPLGHEVGNASEVSEAIDILRGYGAEDETTIALTIASYMAILGGAYNDFDTAYLELTKVIKTGKAVKKLKELVKIQGGNPALIDNPELLPQSNNHINVKSTQSGFISAIDAENIGTSAMFLGAGRMRKEDKIDSSAGITMIKKVGDKVVLGDILCVLHSNLSNCAEAENMAFAAYSITAEQPPKIQFIYDVIQ